MSIPAQRVQAQRVPAKPVQAKTTSPLPAGLLLAGLSLLLVGERIGADADLHWAASGLGALSLAVALLLRVLAFARAKDQVRAVEARLLLGYGAIALGVGLYGLSTDAGLSLLGLQGEAHARAGGLLTAAFVAWLSVSAGAVLFMELAYARMPIPASVELRRVRTALQAGLSLSFSLVTLVCLNYVAAERDVRTDVSYFKTTRPSDGTRSMLSRLEAPIDVVLFFRKDSDVLPRVRPYFEALGSGSDRLRMRVVDFDLAPELARKHRVRGNGNVLLLTGEGEAQKGQSFRIGEELTSARANLRKLDGLFQRHFASLVRAERKVFLTVGHGEKNQQGDGRDPGDGTRVLEEVLTRLNLAKDDLGLADGLGSAVPDGSSAVVIMGPSESFLKEEVDVLLDYVRKGGRVLAMLDPDTDTGLAPLLYGVGLEALPGTVASEDKHMRRTHSPADRALVFSNDYSSHPTVTTASRHASEVASVFVRGMAIARSDDWGKQQPRPNITFPLRSKGKFFRDLDGNFEPGPGETAGQLNLMAAVRLSEGDAEGRIVVIGDGDFMTDKVASNNGNVLVFVDALAWLVGNEELVAEVESEEDVKLEHSREEDKLWFYGTTFAVPVPVVGVGLWVARRRRRRSEAKA